MIMSYHFCNFEKVNLSTIITWCVDEELWMERSVDWLLVHL